MLKKIFLSKIVFVFCSVLLLGGCQNINSQQDNISSVSSSASRKAAQAEYTAWIYTPSTRTIKNTMTEYTTPLEFTIDDVIITEQIPKAKNLKSEYNDDFNTFLDGFASDFGDAVTSNIDFYLLQQQTNLPPEQLQNRISITGVLSFLGHYASIQLSATPSIINQNTGEALELYGIEENTYYITTFYDVKQKKEVESLNELFSQEKPYLTALQKQIQNKILSQSGEPFEVLKRSFSDLSENDFSLYYDSGIDTDTAPHFLIMLQDGNDYCTGQVPIELDLSVLIPYLSFSPNEITDIMDIPNLLTKQFIDTTDTFEIEQDDSITLEECENTLFIAVRNYKSQNNTERINEQLNIAQRIYADTTPILNYMSKAEESSIKVISFKGLGPFLKVFVSSRATVNNQNLFNQRNILIHMPSGEQLAVRDLLLPEYIDTLTEQQLYYLDSTDFSLDESGKIAVPLQPPAEDGTMNLIYESKLFDFEKYSNF